MTVKDSNPRRTARIAGLLYLLLAPLGVLGLIYVSSAIIVPDDIGATINNIIANESIFRLSIVSALLTQVVNVFVVVYLYRVLKPVNKGVAQLMVIFILLGAPIAMFSEVSRVAVLLLVNGAEQSQALIALFLELHSFGISIASIFWGLWLFPMGYLVFKSNYIPKIIGVLLMIGCFGYLFDFFTFFLFPDIGFTVSGFTFIGELVLPLWLLIKRIDVVQWERWVLKTAAI